MKLWQMLFLCLFVSVATSAQTPQDVLLFKTRIGFTGSDEKISNIQLFDNRKKLLIVGRNSFQVWDTRTLKLLSQYSDDLKARGRGYKLFIPSPDGKQLIDVEYESGLPRLTKDGNPEPAFVYDTLTGKQIAVLQHPRSPIRHAEWSNDGKSIVTFSNRYEYKVEISFWNATDFSYRSSLIVQKYGWHYLSGDGLTFFVNNDVSEVARKNLGGTGLSEEICLYDTQTGQLKKRLEATDQPIRVKYGRLAISPDEKYLAAEYAKHILVWEIPEKHLPKYKIVPPLPKKEVELVEFSDDSRHLLTRCSDGFSYYETRSGSIGPPVPPINELKARFLTLQISADKKYAVNSYCSGANITDLTLNKVLFGVDFRCEKQEDQILGWTESSFGFAKILENGKLLLHYSGKGDFLQVRSLKTNEVMQTIPISRKNIPNADDRPNWQESDWWSVGDLVFARSQNDRTIMVWETR